MTVSKRLVTHAGRKSCSGLFFERCLGGGGAGGVIHLCNAPFFSIYILIDGLLMFIHVIINTGLLMGYTSWVRCAATETMSLTRPRQPPTPPRPRQPPTPPI